MFPDLSYLFNYLFGTPVDGALSIIKTFGLMLVLAFLASAYCLRLEFRRKQKLGLFSGIERQETVGNPPGILEIVGNAFFGLVLGLKIPLILSDVSTFSQDPSSLLFSSQGNWVLGILAALVFGGLTYYLGKRQQLETPVTRTYTQYPVDRITDITMVAAFFGVLGSKLFSVLENWDSFIQAPIEQIFSGSGLTIYGGLLLAFVAVYFYVKRLHIKPIHMMDAVAPALIMGYVVGRMGCQLSGDGDWGVPNLAEVPTWFIFPDWMWSWDYPHNVVNDPSISVAMENCGGVVTASGAEPIYCTRLDQPVYPTPIYEIIAGLVIFAILWILRKKYTVAGMLFFTYVLLNGVERFFIEQIRVNPKYELLGLGWSLSQWIAFGLFAIGVTGLIYLSLKGKVSTNNQNKASA